MGDDELNVRGSDLHLLEAIFYTADGVSDVGKSATVEDGFLNTCHEAEAEIFAHFADLAKETKVKNQGLVAAAAQVVEQLVHDQQQALAGKLFVEGAHHGFQ